MRTPLSGSLSQFEIATSRRSTPETAVAGPTDTVPLPPNQWVAAEVNSRFTTTRRDHDEERIPNLVHRVLLHRQRASGRCRHPARPARYRERPGNHQWYRNPNLRFEPRHSSVIGALSSNRETRCSPGRSATLRGDEKFCGLPDAEIIYTEDRRRRHNAEQPRS